MNYLIANWKACITKSQAISWLDTFISQYDSPAIDTQLKEQNISIIICPPYPLIPLVRQYVKPYASLRVGAQHISSVSEGAYTGEVTAEVLADYVSMSIIGHSERRTHFHLTEDEISDSLTECKNHAITPILCIRNTKDMRYDAKIIAYEPVEAIGSGKNATYEDVIAVKKSLSLGSDVSFLYGGSTDETNIKEYLVSDEIQGFLVGGSSLNPKTFFQMIQVMLAH